MLIWPILKPLSLEKGKLALDFNIALSVLFLSPSTLIGTSVIDCQLLTIEYCRHIACRILLPCTSSDFQLCDICFSGSSRNVMNNKATPAKAKAPLSCLTKEKLVATLKDTRVNLKEAKLKCDQLESRIKGMQNEIDQHGITLDSTLEDELTNIITATSLESTPHMKLVWEQQKKVSVNHQRMAIDGTPTFFGLVYHYIPTPLVSIEN